MAQVQITLDSEILKGMFLENQTGAQRTLMEAVLDQILDAQAAEQIGAQRYERTDSRQTSRNGYRERTLKTRVGTLTLHIPKLRDGTFSTDLFARYQRSEQALQLAIMEMYINGVSTRKVTRITETLCGTSFSKSTVSSLNAKLDEEIQAFKQRQLTGGYKYLIADAVYIKCRENKSVQSKSFMIAIAVNSQGFREVVGFEAGDGECEESWKSFFKNLRVRGLSGIEYIVSDNHGGLVNAVKEIFPNAVWQRCQAHFTRNISDICKKEYRGDLKADLKLMFNAPTLEKAIKARDEILEKYQETCPKAMKILDSGFMDATAVYALPKEHRVRMRTSNAIERLNLEIRRRERVVCIFPNENSAERLLGSVLAEIHESWISGKRYVNIKIEKKEKKMDKKAA